jgi:hypothetical protein
MTRRGSGPAKLSSGGRKGEVIHDDYAKEVRWKKLGPPGQGLVR